MYQIDFHKPLHIHFIGIGGISMSGLAEILLGEDFKISGSDSKESPLTDSLTRKGARIFYGQRASNIKDDVECCCLHSSHPSGQPGICLCSGKRDSNADQRRASGTDHAQLRYPNRSFRNPWKDHHYFHDLPYPS